MDVIIDWITLIHQSAQDQRVITALNIYTVPRVLDEDLNEKENVKSRFRHIKLLAISLGWTAMSSES